MIRKISRGVSFAVVAGFMVLASGARAEVTLSALFSDGLVLQSDMLIPVWGNAEPNKKVTVEFAAREKFLDQHWFLEAGQ